MNVRHFINLTNGIEAIADYGLDPHKVRFIRIQSTACEQKRWGDIIMQLSDDFLISAALGYHCVVYDYGANKGVPRAIWQGLEWIKYALWRRWYGQQYRPTGRAITMEPYFAERYRELSPRVKARLDYFKSYCASHLPQISAITESTTYDGDKAYYVEALHAATANLGKGR